MSEVEPECDGDELPLPLKGSVEDGLMALFDALKAARATEGDGVPATQRAALTLMAALLGRGTGSNDGGDEGRADPCGSMAEFDASPGPSALRHGRHVGSTIAVTGAVIAPSFNGGYSFAGLAQRWQHITDPRLSCTFGPIRDVDRGGADLGQAVWWPRWQFEAESGASIAACDSPASGPASGSRSNSAYTYTPYFQISGSLDPPTGALQHWRCGSQVQAVPDHAMRCDPHRVPGAGSL